MTPPRARSAPASSTDLADSADLAAFTGTGTCYEFLAADLPYLGRTSPYIFRLPCPLTPRQLRVIGTRGALAVRGACGGRPVHLVGVATRGIPLATAMAQALDSDDVVLSTVGGDGRVEHVARPRRPHFTVLVDNSVVTGATAVRAASALAGAGLPPELCLRFFDREENDVEGDDPTRRVEQRIGCPIGSLFALRDLLDAERRPARRATLHAYARAHGTEELRAWLTGRGGTADC